MGWSGPANHRRLADRSTPPKEGIWNGSAKLSSCQATRNRPFTNGCKWPAAALAKLTRQI